MKKLLAVCAIATFVSSPAWAQAKQDFMLVNKTGYTIEEVYVSPSKSANWGNDVLGRDTLGNNEKVDIVFSAKNNVCKYDLQVVYDDKETAEWDGFDLCKVSKIIIYYNKKTGATRAEYE